MRYSLASIVAATALFGFVAAAEVPKDAELPAAYVTVEVFPGDSRMFTGDIEEIIADVLAINPDYAFNTTDSEGESSLSKRNQIFPPSCWDLNTHGAYLPDSTFIIRDLRSMNFGYTVAARTCVRMGCIYNAGVAPPSGVALCNENNYSISPACPYLATYVQAIYNSCRNSNRFAGQMFDTDRYNVLVKSFNCGLPQTWAVGQFPN